MGGSESHAPKSGASKASFQKKGPIASAQSAIFGPVQGRKISSPTVANPLTLPPLSSTGSNGLPSRPIKNVNKNIKESKCKADLEINLPHASLSNANTSHVSQLSVSRRPQGRKKEQKFRAKKLKPSQRALEPSLLTSLTNAGFQSGKDVSTPRKPPEGRDRGDANEDNKHFECEILQVDSPSDITLSTTLSDNDPSLVNERSIQASSRLFSNVSVRRLRSPCIASNVYNKMPVLSNDIIGDDDDVLTQDGTHISNEQNRTKSIYRVNTNASNSGSADSSNAHGLARFSSQHIQCNPCVSPTEGNSFQQNDGVSFSKECITENVIGRRRSSSNPGFISFQDGQNTINRSTCESSVSTLNTEGVSSLLYDPCSLCSRVIEDIEHVYRCAECDFVVCLGCYSLEKVAHEHELHSFRRVSKSNVQDATPLSNRSRNSCGNRIINNYVIIRQLGQGSYAKVKLVQSVLTGELFALKILRRPKHNNLLNRVKQYCTDDDLLREVAVMKFIEHPNIVKLTEVIEDVEGGGRLYLIMEYCQLGPVHQLGNSPLPLEKVRHYSRGILSGLFYLHSEFLYHHDIKPANCLVTSDGVVKLADFGTCNSRFRSPSMDGTPAFNCPEIIQGEEVTGDIADSWAFALTLYQMAFGTLPCEGMSALGYRTFIRSDSSVHIPEPGPENTADLSLYDLLSKMLNKDLKQRMLLAKAIYHRFFQFSESEINSIVRKRYSSPGNEPTASTAVQDQVQDRPYATSLESKVNDLYDKALKSVHRGKNLPQAFHGIKDIYMIRHKDLQATESMSNAMSDGSGFIHRHSASLSTSLCKSDSPAHKSESSQLTDLQAIQERIEKQKKQNSQTLDILHIQMSSAPAFINDVASLTVKMWFMSNNLKSLTLVKFSDFTQLKEIRIMNNNLERFPEEVLETPCLVRLDLSHNRITNIPPLSKAACLEQLNLHNNSIHSVGLDDRTGKSLLIAPSLRQVRLSSNPISSLPLGLETLRRLNLVLDANPDLCTQWAKIVEERSCNHAEPNLLFIIWDDYFPSRVVGTDLPIWIASSNLRLYRFQTLKVCECRNVVVFKSANPWFPVGRISGQKLNRHFKDIEFFHASSRRKIRPVGDGNMESESASPIPSLPQIVSFSAMLYVKEFFFISDNEDDPAGGYCSLYNFISDTLQKGEGIMFFLMCAESNMQHTREIAIAALSEYLTTLPNHGSLKQQFDAVMASMRYLP